MIWIVIIASLVVANIIVNSAYQLYMKILGASGMFFDPKKKIFAMIFIALFIASFLLKLFGIETPE